MARCEGCGAQLPAAAPGSSVSCTYCGVATTIPTTPEDLARMRMLAEHGAQDGSRETSSAATAQHGGSGLRWLIGISAFVFVALGIGVAVAMAVWAELDSYSRVQDVVPGMGARTLDPAGLPTPFAALDPIAAYPWALGRAREWAQDATLTSFTIDGVGMNGRVNAARTGATAEGPRGPGAGFFFVSPARMQAARSMRQVSSQQVMTGMQIDVRDGHVEAVANTNVEDGAVRSAFPQPACALDRVVATMRASGLEMRPAYDLICDASSGRWAWWVHMTDLRDTPTVFAEDCTFRR